MGGTSRWTWLPLTLVWLSIIGLIAPQRAGPVALLAVAAPYAYGVVLVLLTPLAVVRRDVILVAALGLAAGVGVLAYAGPPPPQVSAGEADLTVLTWNLHGEDAEAVGLPEVLDRSRPDLVVLQEAGPDAARALAEGMDTVHRPDAATPPGMVLASRYPIRDAGEVSGPPGRWDRPRAFWLEVDAPGGPVTFIGVHLSFPMPIDSLPCPYCPDRRDLQVSEVLRLATERAEPSGRVILAGDFNLVERELAYAAMTALTDAARGLTWRPLAHGWLPPLLRLDYVLIGNGLVGVGADTACELSASDHCPVWVRLRR